MSKLGVSVQETTQEEQQVQLRHLMLEDYHNLKVTMRKAYPQSRDLHWTEAEIKRLLKKFPDGQLCVLVEGHVVACAMSIIVDYKKFGDNHSYKQITGNFTFNTHTEDGDVLYGIDIFVHPDYRGMRLARRLYEARKELCEHFNLRAIIAGGRIPLYSAHAGDMTPREYIEKVRQKELYDPTLSFQLNNDFHVKKILRNYLAGDAASKEYATLLEWNNIYYDREELVLKHHKSIVRLGLVQWQMRPTRDLDAMSDQIEFFVDAVSGYKADFILFPELFNAPLMAQFNHLSEPEAIRELASYSQPLLDKFVGFAIAYNINIITGSMPFLDEDGTLKNVGYLCRRDGTYDYYEKLHITPAERLAWGMTGGDRIKVFDTDSGRIGVQVCYDVEFPELSRLYAEEGMQILFVPFLTDTQNGYTRVRHCAQARAIENECYVAMAGCVGNLPKVNNMDIQYAQSAVFTPSDFAFPNNGVKAETTPNTEMTLIADVDLDLLKELNQHGSVTNLLDRRKDLYALKAKRKTD